ncbi:hypothetical protein WNY97_17295 [Pseudoalteromonas fuliginea]|uniref:hypothetical protein n=1 Tax=Pseudoalteromonas fuliginea TaxID=1872678 RepID=UPI00317950A0
MTKMVFLFFLLCFALKSNANINPKGDDAIFNLSQASIVCAAIQDVNAEAVDEVKSNYLSDAIKLYGYYHAYDYATSKKHQLGWYKILTGEPAVKAQALRSVKGARAYLSHFLVKTDANECSQISFYADKVLAVYNLKLE